MDVKAIITPTQERRDGPGQAWCILGQPVASAAIQGTQANCAELCRAALVEPGQCRSLVGARRCSWRFGLLRVQSAVLELSENQRRDEANALRACPDSLR